MPRAPKPIPRPPSGARFITGRWVRTVGFTMLLVGLVAVASDAEEGVVWVSIATSALAFGFFYFLFPSGGHFGIVTANFLAIYGCMFQFFHFSNFSEAPRPLTLVSLALPVVGFLLTCFLRRERIAGLIHARRIRTLSELPNLSGWFLATMMVGLASFAVPYLTDDPYRKGLYLLAAMTLITGFIVVSIRDVVLVMVDIAMVFEMVARRLDRLLMPMVAFLTFYALLVIIFACLYRVADMTMPVPQFRIDGVSERISFIGALYFSVVSITTVGYGDISPAEPLVRALAAIEIVCGILMLLFGFSEVMRNAGPDSEWHQSTRRRRDSERESP